MVKARLSGLLALWLLPALIALAQDVVLTASVDRDTIHENESFRYVLRAEGQPAGRPDLSALAVEFDVLDSYQTSSFQFERGRTQQISEWVVELMPRGPGSFTLPPVTVGNVRSNAVAVDILPADVAADALGDVFMEVELDREFGYVQAQAVFTLRLYVGIGTGRQTLTAPLIEGGEAIVEKLGADREFSTVRGQRAYNVRERKYAIFPQEPGTLTIGPAVYEAMIMPSRGFARVERQSSDELELEVRPAVSPPAEYPGAVWLPAAGLELAESWSDDGDRFEQGIPRTRTLEVRADGLLETQLPDLSLRPTAGLRQYPDQPELNRIVTPDGIEARRTERFAVIAQDTGTLELPAVELPWFDVDRGRWQVARLASRSIEVLPAANPPPAYEPAAPGGPESVAISTDAGYWPWISGLLGTGWLLTALAFAYVARRRGRPDPAPAPASGQTARSLLRQLIAACRVDDARRTRELLLGWARRQLSDDPPQSLGALAGRLSGPLAEEIRALEAALYGPRPGDWQGARLAELLRQSQAVDRLGRAEPDRDPLLPLYR